MTDNKGSDDQSGDDPRNRDNGQPASGSGQQSPAPGAEQRRDNKTATATADTSAGTHKPADTPEQAASDRTGDSGREPAPQAQRNESPDSGDGPAGQPQHEQDSARPPGQSGNNHNGRAGDDKPKSAPATPAAGSRAAGGGSGNGSGRGESRKGGKLAAVIAIIAVLIALIALAGSGWVWYRSQQEQPQLAHLSARIDSMQQTLKANVQDMVTSRLAEIRSRVDDIAETNAQQAEMLSTLRSELEETRLQMSRMAQRVQGTVRRWQLQQIEHLLIIANRRLQLYGEPAQAIAALRLASEAIAQLNDPRLFDVRKRIIDSIAALKALPSPDIEGMALTLSSFIDQVPDLPLASDVPANYTPEDVAAKTGAAADNGGGGVAIDLSSGWQNFVDSMGTALKSMVTIRSTEGAQPALMPPEQVYFLRQNLMLELRSARLALLEGNSTLYRQSLSSAIEWLKRYFDTGDPAVQAMIDRLGRMQNVKLDWQVPDISGSLVALRDYMQARSKENRGARPQAESGAASSASRQGGA